MKVYQLVCRFKRKYPMTISFFMKRHSIVANSIIDKDEQVIYAFCGQKNDSPFQIFRTFAVVLTNKRLLLAQKRLIFGYLFLAITPDMFNDLTVNSGLLWGKIDIDTIKETVVLTNIQKSALPEIETAITEYMMREKKKYKIERVGKGKEETTK